MPWNWCLRLPNMAFLKLIFVSLILACAIQMVPAFWQPTAQINDSRIIGQTIYFSGIPVHQYLGIPFAEPPLGKLRFQKPKPIETYPAQFEAYNFPPECEQHTEAYEVPWSKSTYNYDPNQPWRWNSENSSEDCLYLNVWAPVGANRWNKKAVLFWIHGGDFKSGATVQGFSDGARLAALGNIIVVTANYRLSFYGFFTTNTTDAPGNVGVWDILEGLKWVNKYIPAFGGDISRITIGGSGAGAIAVGLMSISPLSKGLYARQIMESGSPAYRKFDNNTQNIMLSQMLVSSSAKCAKNGVTIYNSPKEVVECMQNIARLSNYIPRLEYMLLWSTRRTEPFVPQFGDELLVENPRESVINNKFRCTDLLIGSNQDEGAYRMMFQEYLYDQIRWAANEYLNRSLAESVILKAMREFPDPDAIVDYYLPPELQDDTDHQLRHQVYTAFGDTLHLCPAVYYAEKCAEQKKNVYYYYFNHIPSVSLWPQKHNVINWPLSQWINVSHFDETPFVFGFPIRNMKYKASESVLSSQIVDIWSHFVKYGNTNIQWPVYSRENPVFKYLGPDYVTYENGRGPHAKNCEFLRPHFGF